MVDQHHGSSSSTQLFYKNRTCFCYSYVKFVCWFGELI